MYKSLYIFIIKKKCVLISHTSYRFDKFTFRKEFVLVSVKSIARHDNNSDVL